MRILASLALLVSVNAFACPDLTGSFTCTNQDGTTSTLAMSQENKDGVTIYNYDGQSLPADGQVYKMDDSQNLKDGTIKATCDDNANTMNTEILGKYYENGEFAGDLTLDIAMSLDASSNLLQVYTGKIVNQGGDYPINQQMTCTRDKKN